ncbi:MAG: hypothetical protein K2L11_08065 [Muribaculaceae bacterium]|nr:hypothetical protein [Muribaculaceae bacterium]
MDKEKYLSMEETEQLCSLYMECRLSKLEETELEYILGFLPYSSPIIEEARALMSISLSSSMEVKDASPKKRETRRKQMVKRITISAASFLLLMSIGIATYQHFRQQSEIYCQVFAYGKEVGRDKAMAMAEEEMKRIDRFFEIMSDAESEQQQKTDSF